MLSPSNYDDSTSLEQQGDKIKLSSLIFKHDNIHTNLKNLCIQHVPFWKDINPDLIHVKPMLYGITNQVYMVSLTLPNYHTYPIKSVCVKKSSKYNSLVVDSDAQFKVAKLLGDNNFGPKIIGRFGDFTIQEWVPGDTITNESLQNLSVLTGIASSLAKFHKRVTELVPKEWDRTPMFLTKISLWSQHVERIIKKYNLDFDYNELTQNYELFKKIFNNHINTSNSIANSVLFCHNDLFFANILGTNHGIYLIDFGYSGFNYIGWEVASFFKKMYLIYDEVIHSYSSCSSPCLSNEKKSLFVSVYLSELLGKNVLPSDDVVKEFIQSIEIHTLGTRLFWTYWGIVMSDKPIDELSKPYSFIAYSKFEYDLLKIELYKLGFIKSALRNK